MKFSLTKVIMIVLLTIENIDGLRWIFSSREVDTEFCFGTSCDRFYKLYLNVILLNKTESTLNWESVKYIGRYFSDEEQTPVESIKTAFITCWLLQYNKERCEALFEYCFRKGITIESISDYCSLYNDNCKIFTRTIIPKRPNVISDTQDVHSSKLSFETNLKLQIENLDFNECMGVVSNDYSDSVVYALRLGKLLQRKDETYQNVCSCQQVAAIGEMVNSLPESMTKFAGQTITENQAPESYDSLITLACFKNTPERNQWSRDQIADISYQMNLRGLTLQEPITFIGQILSPKNRLCEMLQRNPSGWSIGEMIIFADGLTVPSSSYTTVIQLLEMAMENNCSPIKFGELSKLTRRNSFSDTAEVRKMKESLADCLSTDTDKEEATKRLQLLLQLYEFMIQHGEERCEKLVGEKLETEFKNVVSAFVQQCKP